MTGARAAAFTYHRAVAPGLWMLVALAGAETVVVHGVLALRWPWLGLGLSAVTLPGLVWLIVAIRSMPRRPVLVDRDRLLMRVGGVKSASVPLADIAGVSLVDGIPTDRRRETLNLALVAHPNVLVDLARPIPGRRGRRAIAHRLDDPAAFVAAVDALRAVS